MKWFLLFILFVSFNQNAVAKDIVFQNDNGTALTAGYQTTWMLEETKFLLPPGPCTVKEVQIYFTGTSSAKDTLYIVGDPAEGSVSPTFWVHTYNMKIPPIVFDYKGKPGWMTFPISGLHLDGLDRFVIQHRIQPNGPWFGLDNNGLVGPDMTSWWLNPFETNSLGGPGNYYAPNGDFMVRILVEYDYPDGDGSMPAPPPVLVDVTKTTGLVDANGNPIPASEVSVQDVNNDGWDDIIIGSNLFVSTKYGKFKLDTDFPSLAAGATSWGDFDNDGNVDCYVLRNGAYNQNTYMVVNRDQLYRNEGNLKFTAVTSKDIFKIPYPSPGVDFNLANKYTQDSIFNPYSCITPVWTDYNGDGRLDLFLANNRVGFNNSQGQYSETYFPDQLWQQGADGKFTNTRTASGIAAGEAAPYFDCYGASAVDYNQDNKQDIFVANYRLAKDNLFKNDGDGTFTEVAAQTNVQGNPTAEPGYFGHGMGSEWADFNNDGLIDLAVGNLGHPDWRGMYSNPSLIFKNEGPPNYKFTEKHTDMGLKFFEMNAGILWGDFDLDGYQDLWHGQISYDPIGPGKPMRPGLFYMNQGAPNYKLKDMTWQYGCAIHGPWSAARIDFDHDGDLDLIVVSSFQGVRLFRNDMPKKGSWISIRLKGSPADKVNMDAYGTKVTAYMDGKKYYRELNSVSGTRCNQNSSELHFGIGSPTKTALDSMLVVYSNGVSKTFYNVALAKRYLLPYMGNLTDNGLPTPQQVTPQNYTTGLLPAAVNLNWLRVPGATSYNVSIYSDAGMILLVSTNPATDTTFTSTTLTNNKTYYWKVSAKNISNASAWSDGWCFTVGNLVPLAPGLLSPTKDSTGVLLNPTLGWKAATYDAFFTPKTTYEVNLAKNSSFSVDVIPFNNLNALSIYVPDTLSDNTKYYWRCRGINGTAIGPWSETWAFTTMPLPPAPVLTKPVNGEQNVKNKPSIGWQSITGSPRYQIQISQSQTFDTLFYDVANLSSNSTKVFSNFQSNGLYYWHLRAIKNGYAGPWSETWSFTIENYSSVQDESNNSRLTLSISPNPSDDFAGLKITSTIPGAVKIRIYSITGVLVQSIDAGDMIQDTMDYRLNTSTLGTGIFTISIECSGRSVSKNLIIVK